MWIVGLTNAYNFMDGIDGIAGVQAVVAGLGWLLLGGLAGLPALGALGLLTAASSLGFLIHNWPPARIFMGDVGSAFLGFTFAFLPAVAVQDDPRLGVAGLLGLIAWISIVVGVIAISVRIINWGKRTEEWFAASIGAGSLASLSGLLIHGLTDAVTWGMVKPAPLVWVIWSIPIAVYYAFIKEHSTDPKLLRNE